MLSLFFDDLRVHGHREIAERARLTELVGRPPQVPAVSEEDMPEVLSESQAQQAKVQLIFPAPASPPQAPHPAARRAAAPSSPHPSTRPLASARTRLRTFLPAHYLPRALLRP